MTAIVYSIVIYALVVLLGGVIGFAKAGSTASIVMGAAFALLLLLSSLLVHKKMEIGVYISLILIGFLACFFGYRFFSSFKFMPAGLMMILSIINFTYIFCSRPKG